MEHEISWPHSMKPDVGLFRDIWNQFESPYDSFLTNVMDSRVWGTSRHPTTQQVYRLYETLTFTNLFPTSRLYTVSSTWMNADSKLTSYLRFVLCLFPIYT
jgi:hypothetical protein